MLRRKKEHSDIMYWSKNRITILKPFLLGMFLPKPLQGCRLVHGLQTLHLPSYELSNGQA